MPTKNGNFSGKKRQTAEISCLITGFDPFYGQPFNPSQAIAQSMPTELSLGKTKIPMRSLVLPTIGTKCWQTLEPSLKEMQAKSKACVLIMMGLAARRGNINLERFALNIKDDIRPDNRGHKSNNEKIAKSGPEAFRTNAPIEKTLAHINNRGWPAEISNYAGTFICNEIYYRVLHHFDNIAKKSRLNYSVVFVHLPLPNGYGKTLKAKGTKSTRKFAKDKKTELLAMTEVIKSIAEFNCQSVLKAKN